MGSTQIDVGVAIRHLVHPQIIIIIITTIVTCRGEDELCDTRQTSEQL